MFSFPNLIIDPELHGTVRLALICVEGLEIDRGEKLWEEAFEPLCRELYGKYSGATISHVPGISLARDLYKAIGVDRHALASGLRSPDAAGNQGETALPDQFAGGQHKLLQPELPSSARVV